MVDLILLEYISLVSYIYSIVLMFISFAPINHMIIIFIWIVTISFIYSLLSKKSRILDITILLLLLPLWLYSSKSAVFLMALTIMYIYAYSKRALGQVNYFEYMYKLKINYFIFIVLASVRLILDDLSGSIGYALPFVMIYLVSSIVLTRLMRHLDSNLDVKTIRKTNIKYTIFMGIGLIIGLFQEVRDAIVGFLNKILTTMFYPLYYLFRNFNIKLNHPVNVEEISHDEVPRTVSELIIEEVSNGDEMAQGLQKGFDLFTKIVAIISILALIYILYKLITRTGSKITVNTDYIEEREFIKEKEKKKRRFFREKYPKELKEQIRYYYRRYLEKLKKNKVEILKSDTSKEVNHKAQGVNNEVIDRIRAIYTKARYGNVEVDENLVKEMENLYKNL